ncbi:hypothetical protein NUU61_002239 [Penicillium alfredii]|uniref:Uncharacterized protein n=1 Tax=Penicillium alfredii TaxID=1506179 RepID=A0A9W9FRB1_9EURO|nr:uncharacterized protein NUU61_002239 [Penicillium alfredii]KAJ5104892.1 hypothetical protein NUU61_002239 [Penicillium alfredii]
MSPAEEQNTLDTLAGVSSDSDDIAETISTSNFQQTTPQVINNMKSMTEEIIEKRVTFAQQKLLASLKAKHELLSKTSFAQPITTSLHTLEAHLDTTLCSAIDSMPTFKEDAEKLKQDLDTSLDEAINTYSE